MPFFPLLKSLWLVCLVVGALAGTAVGQFGESVQYFPQMAFGGGATTSFAIHNPMNTEVEVEVQVYSQGSPVHVVTVQIAPRGTETVSVGDPDDELTVGWAKLVSADRFESTEFFQITVQGQELPTVGVLPIPPSDVTKIFCFITADGTDTGVAIANPSETTSATVTATLTDEAGHVVLVTQTALSPLEHMARFLTQEPFFPGLTTFQGTLEIGSSLPVILTTLRSDSDLLSSVAVLIPRRMGELTAGSVRTEHLAQGAVTNDKIADNSVGSAKIIDGSLGPQDLADGAVTQPKLAAASPTVDQVLTWNGSDLQWRDPSGIGEYTDAYSADVTFTPSSPGETKSQIVSCPAGFKALSGGPLTGIHRALPEPIVALHESSRGNNVEDWVVTMVAVTAPGGYMTFSTVAICGKIQ